jgi:Arc/MetJ-type ribon-helix-helix transcriptional regulator
MAVESEYRGVNLKRALLDEVDAFIEKDGTYSSAAAFVSEAVRLRLEVLTAKHAQKQKQKTEVCQI